jgi:hypothetical protein
MLLAKYMSTITPTAVYLATNGYAHWGAKTLRHSRGAAVECRVGCAGCGVRGRRVTNAEVRAYVVRRTPTEREKPRRARIFAMRALRQAEEIIVGWDGTTRTPCIGRVRLLD